MRDVDRQLFRTHLYPFCWKVMRKNSSDLFVSFLEDIRSVYRWNKCMQIHDGMFTFTFLPTIQRQTSRYSADVR